MTILINKFSRKLPKITKALAKIELKVILASIFAVLLLLIIVVTAFDFFPKEITTAEEQSKTGVDFIIGIASPTPTSSYGGLPTATPVAPTSSSPYCMCDLWNVTVNNCTVAPYTYPICTGKFTCECSKAPAADTIAPTQPAATAVPPTAYSTAVPTSSGTTYPTAGITIYSSTYPTESGGTFGSPVPTSIYATTTVEGGGNGTTVPENEIIESLFISNVSVVPEDTTKTLCWDTNLPTVGQISYGKLINNIPYYNQITPLENTYVSDDHCQNIEGLETGTVYAFKIQSYTERNTRAEYQGRIDEGGINIEELPETGKCINIIDSTVNTELTQAILTFSTAESASCTVKYGYELGNYIYDIAGTEFAQNHSVSIPFTNEQNTLIAYQLSCTSGTGNTCQENSIIKLSSLINDVSNNGDGADVTSDATGSTASNALSRLVNRFKLFPTLIKVLLCLLPFIFLILLVLLLLPEKKKKEEEEKKVPLVANPPIATPTV